MCAPAERASSPLSLPSELPFSQSDVSVDPYFYCRLRYVEDRFMSRSFLLSPITFASFSQATLKAESWADFPSPRMSITNITVRGARQHNLQDINVQIPRNTLTVITGLSGSGKSSLAFDTIYAEGQRRYVETLSAYARQFLDQMERPDVDSIDGLSPAISIEQKTTSRSPRSTVGTITEIYDYLRLLFASIGVPHCPKCGRAISRQSADQIVQRVMALTPEDRVMVMAPIVRGRKGEFKKEMETLVKHGYTRARIDGELVNLDDDVAINLDKRKNHTIEVVIDRLLVKPGIEHRLGMSIGLAMKLAGGLGT